MSKPQIALISTPIKGKVYAFGRDDKLVSGVIVSVMVVRAGAARYDGQRKDCVYWLTQHGLTPAEAERFINQASRVFDDRIAVERQRAAAANN